MTDFSAFTSAQLAQWVADMVAELARRAQPAAPPQPPWLAAPTPMQPPPVVTTWTAPPAPAAPLDHVAELERQLAALQATKAQPARPSGTPLWRPTAKSDPAAVEAMMKVAPRPDLGVDANGYPIAAAGLQGNGVGMGGAVEMEPR